MRFVQSNEDSMRRESLANKFANTRNQKEFWEELRKNDKNSVALPNVIDDIQGTDNIVQMWKSHYDSLFNCSNDRINVKSLCSDVNYSETMIVKRYEIVDALAKLDDGKSSGMDGVYAEHLKYSSPRLVVLLSLCFSSLFVHGFLPRSMISVILVPLVKNKSASICTKSNYRPIALASVISKLMEYVLYKRLESFLDTTDNQFGFKQRLGTDMCIFALKEAVLKYRGMNSNVYCCFLDASKAFDRVNHFSLF